MTVQATLVSVEHQAGVATGAVLSMAAVIAGKSTGRASFIMEEERLLAAF
jgi:hypothetical protein